MGVFFLISQKLFLDDEKLHHAKITVQVNFTLFICASHHNHHQGGDVDLVNKEGAGEESSSDVHQDFNLAPDPDPGREGELLKAQLVKW